MANYSAARFYNQMTEGGSSGYKQSITIISLVYGIALASLPIDVFLDRLNYLAYAEFGQEIFLGGMDISPGYLLANEPVWLILNWFLFAIFSNPVEVIRFYIFCGAALFAFLLLKVDRRSFWLLLLFLFFPQIIKNYIVHLRQGVAISIFFLGWTLSGFRRRWLIIGITPFIHSSFFVILAILLLTSLVRRLRISIGVKILLLVLASICLAISLEAFARLAGARQYESYIDSVQEVSGLGFSFWLFILTMFFLEGRDFFRKHMTSFMIIMIYLVTYFFIPVTARVFESGLVLVLISGLFLSSYRKILFVNGIIFFTVLSYIIQYDQPWLGFGY